MSSSTSPALTVRFRGVRGSIPSPGLGTARYGGNTACIELRYGGEILILDAGSGIRSLGADLGAEFGSRSVEASLLISHTHWDHIQGLPFFAPLYSGQNRIRIIGANGNASLFRRALRNQMHSMHFPVDLENMRGLAGVEQLASDHAHIGKFTIAATALNHPGGCTGFRIEGGGATVAYLPDHEPHLRADAAREALLGFIAGVDLLILDTQYTAGEYEHYVGWGHGCLPASVALALEAGVDRLFFFHHDPSHLDSHLDEMVKEARGMIGSSPLQIQAAAENEVFILSSLRKVMLQTSLV